MMAVVEEEEKEGGLVVKFLAFSEDSLGIVFFWFMDREGPEILPRTQDSTTGFRGLFLLTWFLIYSV